MTGHDEELEIILENQVAQSVLAQLGTGEGSVAALRVNAAGQQAVQAAMMAVLDLATGADILDADSGLPVVTVRHVNAARRLVDTSVKIREMWRQDVDKAGGRAQQHRATSTLKRRLLTSRKSHARTSNLVECIVCSGKRKCPASKDVAAIVQAAFAKCPRFGSHSAKGGGRVRRLARCSSRPQKSTVSHEADAPAAGCVGDAVVNSLGAHASADIAELGGCAGELVQGPFVRCLQRHLQEDGWLVSRILQMGLELRVDVHSSRPTRTDWTASLVKKIFRAISSHHDLILPCTLLVGWYVCGVRLFHSYCSAIWHCFDSCCFKLVYKYLYRSFTLDSCSTTASQMFASLFAHFLD